MPKPEITTAEHKGTRYEVGQRVCVKGEGIALGRHAHGVVKRFTATQMVVETRWTRGEHSGTSTTRYWLTRSYGAEVGADSYGGSNVTPIESCTGKVF